MPLANDAFEEVCEEFTAKRIMHLDYVYFILWSILENGWPENNVEYRTKVTKPLL